VIKQITAKAAMVIAVGASPFADAKFMAVAIVPGPARMGIASGDTATES
jgi:hypothetical protein